MWPKCVSTSSSCIRDLSGVGWKTVTVHSPERMSWNDELLSRVLNYTNCYWLPLKVRENRARREAERQRQQRERVSQLGAREEAKRREHEEEARKKQEARRQEELVQQEMVRLRRQMEERKTLEQLVRKRYGLSRNNVPISELCVILSASSSYSGWNWLMITWWWAGSLTLPCGRQISLWPTRWDCCCVSSSHHVCTGNGLCSPQLKMCLKETFIMNIIC